MSMLKSLWNRRGRVKHLEACNLDLAHYADDLQCERDAALAECRNVRESWAQTITDMNKVIAERDATARSLEETTASLIDAKRRNGHLLDEFDRLAGMFRKKLADLHAAEELLDEAGEQIDNLRWTRDTVIAVLGERSVKLDQIAKIARR